MKSRRESIIGWAAMFGSLIAVTWMFAGCKPTEKNYREAYDTAQRMRAAERNADAELGIPGLTATNGPRRQAVGVDTVYVRREALTLHGDNPMSELPTYSVAVGKYKMTANALSDVEYLRSAGYDAYVLTTSNGEFYSIAAGADTIEEAVRLLRLFVKKHPERPYVGLPGEPVIEIPLGRG